jgi:dienelactone hydrolase
MAHPICKVCLFMVAAVFSTQTVATVKTKTVTYQEGDTKMVGYIAYDDKFKGKRPGVLVVHEWWGHNDYVRERARMLAKLGYVAFAVDMYGDGKKAEHPKDAGKFAGQVRNNLPLATARFNAALKELKAFEYTDPNKIAAIGYCFGGGVVLEMARSGLDIAGVVSFHGSLNTDHPAEKGKVKARILVLNGDADPFVKPEQITQFKQEMSAAGVNYEFIGYPGAKHAFTNPGATDLGKKFGLPLAYSPSADKASWKKMQAFFKEIFK